MVNLFDPCDPYMTFEVKLLITFVATDPLIILTSLVEIQLSMREKKQIVRRKERKKERTRNAVPFARARAKLGGVE